MDGRGPTLKTKKLTFDPELAAAIGFRIRLARQSMGFTLRDLEARTSITNGAISGYENGRCVPTATVIINLCRSLHLSPNELLGWEEEP